MDNSLQPATEKIAGMANPENARDQRTIQLYRLKNKNGFEARITAFGARLLSLKVPVEGDAIEVIAGSDKPNALHDDKHNSWAMEWAAGRLNENSVELVYFSKNADDDFPGNLRVKRTYFLNEDNSLKIVYEALTDKATVVNLANNCFFNLNGRDSGNILNHQLWIKADSYMLVDENVWPTGVIEPVAGTPFDFRNSATIGSRINDHHEQLKNGSGYDHNFVLNTHASRTPVARVRGDKSGIIMEIFTDQPGLQFYSGNFIKGKTIKKDGEKEDCHTAFAIKTRHFSDLPTSPGFPLTALKPGKMFRSVCCYQFKI